MLIIISNDSDPIKAITRKTMENTANDDCINYSSVCLKVVDRPGLNSFYLLNHV